MDMEDFETVLLVKREVFVYKIPPRASNRGYRADEWKLDAPDWTGRLRVVIKGKECSLKLEDPLSGELFAKCPVDKYPGLAIEAVLDSSRYFVLRIMDDNGRSAFIGMGFADRADSFDLNVALQDHFKWIKTEEQIAKEATEPQPQLDLSFKEGQTIHINMKFKKDGQESSARPKPKTSSTGILPPPPGGVKIAPPPAKVTPTSSPVHHAHPPATSNTDLLGDLGGHSATGGSDWGDFTSANSAGSQPPPASSSSQQSWVQF